MSRCRKPSHGFGFPDRPGVALRSGHRIEEGLCDTKARADAPRKVNIGRQPSVRHGPIHRRLIEARRKKTGGSCLERAIDRAAQFAHRQAISRMARDEDGIAEVLHSTASASSLIGARVRVELLGNVLLQRQDGDVGCRYLGESEQRLMRDPDTRESQVFRGSVDHEFLEQSPADFDPSAVPARCIKLVGRGAFVVTLDSHDEMIDDVCRRDGEDCAVDRISILRPSEIEVSGRSRKPAESHLERDPTFHQPEILVVARQSGQESVKCNGLSPTNSFRLRQIAQSVLDCRPERRTCGVFHWPAPCSACATSFCTLGLRCLERSRSSDGVTRPRAVA